MDNFVRGQHQGSPAPGGVSLSHDINLPFRRMTEMFDTASGARRPPRRLHENHLVRLHMQPGCGVVQVIEFDDGFVPGSSRPQPCQTGSQLGASRDSCRRTRG